MKDKIFKQQFLFNALVGCLTLMILTPLYSMAASNLDATFGNGGIVTDFGGNERISAVVLQTDGKSHFSLSR